MGNEKLTPKKLSMSACDALSSAIVNAIFIESEDGSNDFTYMPQVRDMISLYLKLNSFFPELNVKDIPIEDFFEKYSDGEYQKYEDVLLLNRRAIYVDESVDSAINAKLKEFNGGRMQSVVLRLLNALNYVVETQAVKFNDLGAADVKKFISDFAGFSTKNNAETLTRAAVDMEKKKKTTK